MTALGARAGAVGAGVRALGAPVRAVGAVAALALVLWAVYGAGYVEYDAAFALLWGGDLSAGRLPPDLRGPVSPTPHPLATVAGALLAPLGADAMSAVSALAVVLLAALGFSAYRLGRALCSSLVGVVFALVLLTRPLVVKQGLAATVDVPFLALVLGAAALEADRPRRASVLALLSVAGLLRPEAWLLAAAYLAYLWPACTGRARARLAVLAASAPLTWAAVDLVTTGDPLHSLHWTGAGAARLGRPTGLDTALLAAPGGLRGILGALVLAGGLLGAAIAVRRLGARVAPPLVLAGLMTAAFLVSGAAGLAVLPRYLLAPAAVLALLFALAAVGWRGSGRSVATGAWAVAGVALLAGLAASLALDRGGLAPVVQRADERRGEDRSLSALAAAPSAAASLRGCRPIRVHYYRLLPVVAYLAGERPGNVTLGAPVDASRGIVLVPAGSAGPPGAPGAPFRRVHADPSFALYARCGGES